MVFNEGCGLKGYTSRKKREGKYLCIMIIKPFAFKNVNEVLEGGLFLIDKPHGWTSHDVVGKLKWLLRRYGKAPKFKIGHAGTLDPLATGLLAVCSGKWTKRIEEIQGGEKEYTGIIMMGQTTPSYDLETTPEGSFGFDHLSSEALLACAAGFLGEQYQTPPVYSAKQIDGKRAYESARAGKEVTMRQSLIVVHAFELTHVALPEVHFKIRCSKGTYIRSIASDFGKRLQSGSYLKELRRTESAPFRVEAAMSIEEAEELIKSLPVFIPQQGAPRSESSDDFVVR